VRERGVARVDQSFIVGITAMAAPIFSNDGRVAAALTVLGRSHVLDIAWDGTIARAILAFTAACSDKPSP